ncbi:MAG: VCBS repeat-containing protein, partial [Bdellovibrionales bacterium]|nr:VCBS repeat-containing protein [Bdellovibrionales bacterium]
MSISYASTISALAVRSNLSRSSSGLSKAFQRLSSGLRINHVNDDPGGSALASSVSADSQIMRQGVRNASDTVSLLNVADAATKELRNILVRVSELTEQAASGTTTSTQRLALHEEATALESEYNRIVDTTIYNTRTLLDGSVGTLTTLIGSGEASTIAFDLGIESTTAEATGTYNNLGISSPSSNFIAGVSSGDFNEDGINDIIVGSSGFNDEYILMGNGDGTFEAPLLVSGLTDNYDLDVGDFNGDGHLDIALTDITNNKVHVKLGVGDGTFGAAISSASGNGTKRIALGDFDGDGNLDIATASLNDDTVRILIGNGNGTFDAPISYASGNQDVAFLGDIQTGDFNGDGFTDVAVTNSTTGAFGILLGNG